MRERLLERPADDRVGVEAVRLRGRTSARR
ncbi:hypothetical protein EV216_12436 [Rhodovulum steppense]|uniref:Uncharacterized protein n=1 Tax=Rhodovulum steppense TaxID=540251 RepID=A0A4R1YMK6_9RHOB|nr:hypothetical protein EV216_12436 [Rhodovulum steppense]